MTYMIDLATDPSAEIVTTDAPEAPPYDTAYLGSDPVDDPFAIDFSQAPTPDVVTFEAPATTPAPQPPVVVDPATPPASHVVTFGPPGPQPAPSQPIVLAPSSSTSIPLGTDPAGLVTLPAPVSPVEEFFAEQARQEALVGEGLEHLARGEAWMGIQPFSILPREIEGSPDSIVAAYAWSPGSTPGW